MEHLTPFDLKPTDSLTGLHMRGMVRRRFLINYPVDPSLLEPFLPPGGQLSRHQGKAWFSDCFVHVSHMRPSIVPSALGLSFRCLIHRTRAVLPFPDGKNREAVLVLDPSIDSRLLGVVGTSMTGVPFKRRPIEFVTDGSAWRIAVREGTNVIYEVMIRAASFRTEMPANSPFTSLSEADDFLLGVSYGGSWDREDSTLQVLAETHDPWQAQAGTCDVRRNAFLKRLGIDTPRADHVITMVDCPHYFAMKGHKVSLKADGRAVTASTG
jgi:uncharacterized protein YqjF (DUF2071 family)